MYEHRVELKPDEDAFLATFPDLPFGATDGDTREEALARAVGLLESILMVLMDDRRDIPRAPKPRRGQAVVTLPALSAAKVALYEAMRAGGVRKAELARRLRVHMPQVDRLLDLRHASRLDQVEAALRAVGKQLVVSVEDAA